MRKRTSILANKEIFIEAVNKSDSVRSVLIHLGLRSAGGNHSAVKRYAKIHGVKLPDGAKTRNQKLNEVTVKRRIPLEEVLLENSNYSRGSLKRRLLEAGLLKNRCAICGLGSTWNKKPIALQLDHRNGIFNDNRIKNLRLLCPNCHSQTRTFGYSNRGRKNMKRKKMTYFQKKYSIEKSRRFRLSKEELRKIIWEKPAETIGKEHNVSGKCIEKYCKKWGIEKPPRGYWAKVRAGKIKVREN